MKLALALAVALTACGTTGDPDSPGQSIAVGQSAKGALQSSDTNLPPGASAPFTADHFTLSLAAGQTVSVEMCRCTSGSSGDMDPELVVAFAGSVIASDDDCGGNHGALVRFTAPQTGTYDLYPEDCCREPIPADGMSRRYVLRVVDGTVDPGQPGGTCDAGAPADASVISGVCWDVIGSSLCQ